jgi:phosphoribosylglycinamide formyltransferase-1
VSGTGSNLEAMIKTGLPIAVVAADRECRALRIAKEAGIPIELVERADFGPNFDRAWYTEKLMLVLRRYGADTVAMAGFMTLLSPGFFAAFGGRVVNTHPSLLPLFKGDHAVSDALSAGATETGCTIHIATEALDDGPILAQAKVPVLPGDTADSLHERIKEAEHALYPKVLKDILSGAIIPSYN